MMKILEILYEAFWWTVCALAVLGMVSAMWVMA